MYKIETQSQFYGFIYAILNMPKLLKHPASNLVTVEVYDNNESMRCYLTHSRSTRLPTEGSIMGIALQMCDIINNVVSTNSEADAFKVILSILDTDYVYIHPYSFEEPRNYVDSKTRMAMSRKLQPLLRKYITDNLYGASIAPQILQ